MNFTLERLTAPDIEPVTVAEAKTHLRIDSDSSVDAQLTTLIQNAREWVEGETGQILIDQTWRLTIGDVPYSDEVTPIAWGPWSWAGNAIYLRRTPILAITKFVTVGTDGVETDVDAGAYLLREAGSKYPKIVALSGGTWTAGPMVIEFRAGYADRIGSPTGDATRVPARFKQAMLLHVEAHYDRDERMMDKLLQAACNNVAKLVAHLPFA